MAFKVSEKSLFAVLSRSPWWYSVLIGIGIIAISMVFVSGQYLIIAICGALPFFGIATYAGYQRSKLPSQERVLEVVAQARKMTSSQVASNIAANYTEARYDSEPFNGAAADIELTRGNQKILLCTKRFKAGSTGIEPLKQLVLAGEKAEATEHLYVALGDVSDAAWDFANENDIELIQATRLAAHFDGQANIE